MNYFQELVTDPIFLLMTAGFEGVVLALFVPVSLDVVSKTSAKYNSDVIVRLYKESFANRIFPYFLLINIVGLLTMRFIMTPELGASVLGKSLMGGLFGSTLIISGMVGYLIYRMEQFVSSNEVPLRMLYSDLKKASKIKNPKAAHTFLIDTVSGIGDILEYQVQRQNNIQILRGLSKIRSTIDYLIQLKTKNPQKFMQLVYNSEFSEYIEKHKADPAKYAEFCFVSPDKNLAGFAVPVNQLIRIYASALRTGNIEVGRKSLQHIYLIFHANIREQNNELLVEWMLKKISEITNIAMRADEDPERISFSWYMEPLFGEPHLGSGSFNLSYLDLCERYFLNIATAMIMQGGDKYYRRLVDSTVRQFVFPNHQRGKVWGYHYLLQRSNPQKYKEINLEHEIQRKVRRLLLSEHMIQTMDDLTEWKGQFMELKGILQPYLAAEYRKEADSIESSIISYVTAYYKYRRFVRLFYALGIYCQWRERYDMIRYLWEAGQKVQGVYSLLPPNAHLVMTDYFTYPHKLNRHYFKDAYNPMEIHRDRYYILFLAYLLKNEEKIQYRLPVFALTDLQNLVKTLDKLIDITKNLVEEHLGRLQALWQSELSVSQDDEQRLQNTLEFLKQIKRMAQKQLAMKKQTTQLNPKRIELFKSALSEGFFDQAVFRALFSNYIKSYSNKTNKTIKALPQQPWGIRELANRNTFLQESDIKAEGWNYAKSLADQENMFFFERVLSNCRKISPKRFDKSLEAAGEVEDVFILSSGFTLENFLIPSDKFRSHTLEGPGSAVLPEAAMISGFIGYYCPDDRLFPVFSFAHRKDENQLLILNRKRLGEMIQLPIQENSRKKLFKDIFEFNMEGLSTKRSLVDQYMKAKPDWLLKQGDQKQQREYLRQRVLILIQLNPQFVKADDFIGYKMLVRANISGATSKV